MSVSLRAVVASDLPILFEYQTDPEANRMAAFTPKDPSDRDAYMEKWTKLMADPTVTWRTIVVDGQVAGSIVSFVMFGDLEISYWIGRAYWGRGVATSALQGFLGVQTTRPLHARAAKDNYGSLRVLEKCGFRVTGADRGFANARGEEIDEVVLRLS